MHDQIPTGKILAERYRIHRILGEGAMGTVYAVDDTLAKEEVALKVVHITDDAGRVAELAVSRHAACDNGARGTVS